MSAAVDAYLAGVADGVLGRVADADVLVEVRVLGVLRRRLTVADHALVGELDRRGVPGRLVMASTAALLQGVLRLSPRQAAGRVAAARLGGPRTPVTGGVLPPVLPELAAAHAEGPVSAEHTTVILEALDELAATVSPEDRALAQKQLVQAATTLAPRQVATVGRRILAHLHPDGAFTDDTEQQRHRWFGLRPNPDGSYTAAGRLSPTCGAQLLACLTPQSTDITLS